MRKNWSWKRNLNRRPHPGKEAFREKLLPRNFHGDFRGSSRTHNLLKSGEPAGTRTQDPRLKRASGLVALTNDQVRLSAKNPLRNEGLQDGVCAGMRLQHISNRDQNRARTVTRTVTRNYVDYAASRFTGGGTAEGAIPLSLKARRTRSFRSFLQW